MNATRTASPLPIVACWSGGKDSALMLDRLRCDTRFRIVGLITMVTTGDRRISMHGVSADLLLAQVEAIGLPLVEAEIPAFPANAVYEGAFVKAIDRYRSLGVRTVAFGDLFLADIRAYREHLCARLGLDAVFPLWGEDTSQLAAEFLARGFRAVICCVDAEKLPRHAAGSEYNADFVARLPAGVDPCGENGEFHTFVTAGPVMAEPLDVEVIAVTRSERFWYAELQPSASMSPGTFKQESRPPRGRVRESIHV